MPLQLTVHHRVPYLLVEVSGATQLADHRGIVEMVCSICADRSIEFLGRLALVAALAAGASAGHAQLSVPMPSGSISSPPPATGPSIEEATKWITGKLVSTPSYMHRGEGAWKVSALFDGCEMLLTEDQLPSGIAHRYFVRLQDLDPVSVKASAFRSGSQSQVILKTRDDKPLVMHDVTSTKKHPEGSGVPSNYAPPPQSSLEGMARLKAGRTAPGFWVKTYSDPYPQRYIAFPLEFSDFPAAQELESGFRTAIELCTAKAQRESTAQK